MNPVVPALRALQSGDAGTAEKLLTAILKATPDHPDALQVMGAVRQQKGELGAAVDYYRRSLKALPTQPMLLVTLANLQTQLTQDDDARQSYERAIALDGRLADAHYNLGLLHSRLGRWDDAIGALQRASGLQPDNGRSYEALGIALREAGDVDAAVNAAERGAQLQANSLSAQHNLGQAYLGAGDNLRAAVAYRKALALNGATVASWIGLGHALRGLGDTSNSRAAYQRAVDLDPSNTDAHRLLNEMVWQTGDAAAYLTSFTKTLGRRPDDPGLRLTYAKELLKIQQPDEAARELEMVLRAVPTSGDALDAMARARSFTGDFDAACGFHARAIDASPSDSAILRNFSETLLRARQHRKAHEVTRAGRERFPLEQGVLALHTTAQRLVGDEDYARLADYAGIPRVKLLEPPPGYSDIETFCAELKTFLEGLHATRAHPTDQTLRGGTQTFGALFRNREKVLQDFVTQLRKAIGEYISEMPDDPTHPLFQRRRRDFDFAGSWSVRLSNGGFHTNHFHPMGWISSAFYVDVPEVASVNGRRDGWFKMGETNLELGDREVIHRYIQPKPGSLTLFPSYFWHGTVPFESNSSRITIAFDVIPK